MSKSLPSKPCISLDIPESKKIEAIFVYNFFQKDERISENGLVNNFNNLKNGEEIDSETQLVIEKKVSRYVRLDYSGVSLGDEERIDLNFETPENYIQDNIDKIYYEDSMNSLAFSTVDFQDTGIDGKMFLLASGTLAKKFQAENKRISDILNREIENLGFAIDAEKITLLEAAQYLKSRTSVEISDKTVLQSLNRISSLQRSFLDEQGLQQKIFDAYEDVRSLNTRTRINNKFIRDAINSSVEDTLGIYADEMSVLLEDLDSIQEDASVRHNSTMTSDDYDIVVEPVFQKAIPIGTFYEPTKRIVGYIIEKFRVSEEGKLEPMQPVVVESNNSTVAIDYMVSYGENYCYQVRAIAEMTFNTIDEVTDDNLLTAVLVASSPSPRVFVDCVENVPPKPPTDINFSWDYAVNKLRMYWSLPVNPQRDIKHIQIFRRRSIKHPFELIQQFDFDDSFVKTEGGEYPDENLVQKLKSDPGIFYDEDFAITDEYIYALASIDAHGLTSNYSIQTKVKVNNKNNRIERKHISKSGAPKQYPNMYISPETGPFAKILTDSLHSQMTLYFEPEYFEVYGKGGTEDLDLLQTIQKNGKYRMQLINVDLQKAQSIDIKLDDKRRKS